jgi:hypothetical protein
MLVVTVALYYPYFSFVQSAYQIFSGGEQLRLLRTALPRRRSWHVV